MLKRFALFACMLSLSILSFSRDCIKLDGSGWKVWLDVNARWENDTLYLPKEIDRIDRLPVNPPTVGWDMMYQSKGQSCTIPACVEEIFSNGDPSWKYHGVSWFWKEAYIPDTWKGKTIRIQLESTRLRAELYVNGQLAGYSIINELPWEAEISKYLKYGEKNIVALRITNPGGVRGWNDGGFDEHKNNLWGDYMFPVSHDFGGIGGGIQLVASDPVYVSDIFVRNLLPADKRAIEIYTTLNNPAEEQVVDKEIKIYSYPNGNVLYRHRAQVKIGTGEVTLQDHATVPEAQLWDIDSPYLYVCEVSIKNKEIADCQKQRFGFRTFEVKNGESGDNFYFNNRRVRFRSAVDWMYFDHSGMYPTQAQARRTIQYAKEMGMNAFNGHRFTTYQTLFENADLLGLYMYEEIGGFHESETTAFSAEYIREKAKRMIIRNRNNPSLTTINLSNEDESWNGLREEVMNLVNSLSMQTLYITNTSGNYTNPVGNYIQSMRPYTSTVTCRHSDPHWLDNGPQFQEKHFGQHHQVAKDTIRYWGECHMYSGPANSCEIVEDRKFNTDGRTGYNIDWHTKMNDMLNEYFDYYSISDVAAPHIKTPKDLTRQMARGQMYSAGRACQDMMAYDYEDGFAFNGWGEGGDDFTCGLLNGIRTPKGPVFDFAYWIRDLQIVVQRKNGKYFRPGDTANFDLFLINERKIESGDYLLDVQVSDASGKVLAATQSPIKVEGGDVYTQQLMTGFPVSFSTEDQAGFVTVNATLYKGKECVTTGKEQVLLQNRASFGDDIKRNSYAVIGWPEAKRAIEQAGGKAGNLTSAPANYILAANGTAAPLEKSIDKILEKVAREGSTLILKFDEEAADLLYRKGLLSEKVTLWRGKTIKKEGTAPHDFNGWGYINKFVGGDAFPGKDIVSTNSWECPGSPMGFYPFKSNYPVTSYGAFLFRGPFLKWSAPDLTILLGQINYGKGKILLNPCYHVDEDNAFNDLLFFNFIRMGLDY